MGYFRDYIIAVIENKDEKGVEYIDTFFQIEDISRYEDRAEWLNNHYNFLKPENVEFGSLLMGSLSSWGTIKSFDTAVGIDTYDKNSVYNNADVLLKYNETVGIPNKLLEMLETYAILKDFKKRYKDINSDNRYDFDSGMIEDIINNKKYDIYNKEQVEALSELVYANFDDENHTFSQSTYSRTRMFNQLALNADLDDNVMDAIEHGSVGWYAEDIEAQLDKVDMADFTIQRKKDEREDKNINLLTLEKVNELKKEYEGVLDIVFREGAIGLEDQVNDYIVVKFNNEVIYEDDGHGNSFGDTKLNGRKLFKLLADNDYKAVNDIFLF